MREQPLRLSLGDPPVGKGTRKGGNGNLLLDLSLALILTKEQVAFHAQKKRLDGSNSDRLGSGD